MVVQLLKLFISVNFVLLSFVVNAQDSTSKLVWSGYLETYYSYDLGKPLNHERPSFFYSFNRHNEANLNIGFIKANYTASKVRANLALMSGTYSQYNYSSEQSLLQHVYEANAGIKLNVLNNIWLDAGIMPSHIGFESAIGKDCWNLTRSILADNSPYYETGAKLGYSSSDDKFYFAVLYLNGWQKIQRVKGNNTPAFGTQITWKPNCNTTFNYSNYVGNEQADSTAKWRHFHNFYLQKIVNDKLGLILGFDIGQQQEEKVVGKMNTWFSPVVIGRFIINKNYRIAARAEYYQDKGGVIIATGTPNGFKTYGYSLNIDYTPSDNVMLRLEGRGLSSKDQIFTDGNKAINTNYFITTSLAVSF